MASMTDEAAEIAARFIAARHDAARLDDYPGHLPATLDAAYAVQDAAIAAWRQPVIGWKVGRINPPHLEQFGADRLAGPIFRSERAGPDGAGPDMPVFASGFAAAEVEFRVPVPEADRLQGPPEVAWRPTGDDKDAIVSLARTVGEHADTLNKLLFTYLDYAVIARKA